MDIFARGAYYRAKKILSPRKSKKGSRLTVGMDGVRRKRKRGKFIKPTAQQKKIPHW